ncbi:MAG: hypothetical protein K2W91_04670 [Novosphingobium sp.]|nr:hypothetical protein [Novosphingobium sp.]
MQFLPIALAAAAGGIKAYGQLKAGNATRKAAYGQARETEVVGAEQELRVRAAAAKTIGAQRAAQAGNGFRGDSGSALDALAESYTNMTLDVLQLRRDAAMRARSLRAEGDQARTQGRLGAVAAILGTASSVAGMKGDWAAAKATSGPSDGGGGGSGSGGGLVAYSGMQRLYPGVKW